MDLISRIEKHNIGFYGKKFTSVTSDCELYLSIECKSVSQAVRIEKHIKRMKSRKYIQNLKAHPEIAERLKLKHLDLQ